MDTWVCPNDRQLALRAKLGTGWSMHTTETGSLTRSSQLTFEEQEHIMRVIRQAELVEHTEMERIGLLVDRVDNMKKNVLGDGTNQCLLCGEEFGLLGASASECEECSKAVCNKCGVDTFNSQKQSVWLCKICSENRELWKRSGAWFYKGLPQYIRPAPKKPVENSSMRISTLSSKSGVLRSSSSQSARKTYGSWSRTSATQLADQESSESDDDVTICRQKAKPAQSDTSSSGSSRDVSVEPSSLGDRFDQTSFRSADTTSTAWDEVDSSGLTGGPTLDGFTQHGSGQNTISSSIASDQHSTSDLRLVMVNPDSTPVSAPMSPDTAPLLGSIEFSLLYSAVDCKLQCVIHRAKNLPSMDSNGFSDPYVKLHLLPGANKSTKLRTKTIHKTLNPEWNETLTYYGITEADTANKTLRLTVLDENTFQFQFIGEARVPLKQLMSGIHRDFNIYLAGLVVEKDDDLMNTDRGRILVSLLYDTSIDRLTIGIRRCAGLAAMDSNGFSDPYVKIYLKPDKQKKSKLKTKVMPKTLNPEFNEEFTYSVKQSELAKKTLEITVWDRDRGRSSDYIGGIQLGINAKGECLRHWFQTLKDVNQVHEQWHVLSQEQFGSDS